MFYLLMGDFEKFPVSLLLWLRDVMVLLPQDVMYSDA